MIFYRFVAACVAGYLLGAIPFSLVIGKTFFKIDLRQFGSGSLGTTNTLRVLGGRAALAVLLLDALKGTCAVWVAWLLVPTSVFGASTHSWALVVGTFAAIFGHAFSPYIDFKGGKGVATTAGAVLAMQPIVACILIVLFIIIVYSTRYVSVASMVVATLYPIMVLVFYRELPFILFAFIAAILIIWLHRANIVRLIAGEESKISIKHRGSQSRGDH